MNSRRLMAFPAAPRIRPYHIVAPKYRCASQQNGLPIGSYGSSADMAAALSAVRFAQEATSSAYFGSSIMLTWAATTRQPSGKRTQVCICRPTFVGALARWNSVEATAWSRP